MVKLASAFTKAGDGRRHFFLGAIGIRADGAIVMARNEPTQIRNPKAHAESRLVKKLGLHSPFVLVVRLTKNGTLALAKPCKHCQKILESYKVKKIFYTTDNGIRQMRL